MSIIKWLLFYATKFEVVCYAATDKWNRIWYLAARHCHLPYETVALVLGPGGRRSQKGLDDTVKESWKVLEKTAGEGSKES